MPCATTQLSCINTLAPRWSKLGRAEQKTSLLVELPCSLPQEAGGLLMPHLGSFSSVKTHKGRCNPSATGSALPQCHHSSPPTWKLVPPKAGCTQRLFLRQATPWYSGDMVPAPMPAAPATRILQALRGPCLNFSALQEPHSREQPLPMQGPARIPRSLHPSLNPSFQGAMHAITGKDP